jgi:hypothetical protein
LICGGLAATALLIAPAHALAQGGQSVNGLGDAILQLNPVTVSPTLQQIRDLLFNGRINATISDDDNNNTNFANGDTIAFALTPVAGGASPLTFIGTRPAFDAWVDENAEGLLAILFPNSLSEGASGIDVAQSHSQQFLVSTALAAGGRGNMGGRLEYERFGVEQTPGNALQGLFRTRAVALELRYAQLNDTIRTRSTTAGVNVHPSWTKVVSATELRVGGDAYFSTLYSTSRAVDLASLDYGGGGWASGAQTFARARVSFGALLMGSKTHIPSALVDEAFAFVADVLNERPLRWDVTYGGAAEYSVARQVVLGAKALQSRSVKSDPDAGRNSQLFLVHLGYIAGGDSPIDLGYKFWTAGNGFQAHGFFMNANVQW